MEEIGKILNGGIFVDDRGPIRFVNDFDFKNVKRFYQVENHERGFIRAWHGHKKEGKYVYVARGSAWIGVINMETLDNPHWKHCQCLLNYNYFYPFYNYLIFLIF